MNLDYGVLCSHYKQLDFSDLAPIATLVDKGFRQYQLTSGERLMPCSSAALPQMVRAQKARQLGISFVEQNQLGFKTPVEIDDLLGQYDIVSFLHFDTDFSFYLRGEKHFAVMLSGQTWETDRWVTAMGLAHHLLKHMDTFAMDTLPQPRLIDNHRQVLKAEAELLAAEVLLPKRLALKNMRQDTNRFAETFGVPTGVAQRRLSQMHIGAGVH